MKRILKLVSGQQIIAEFDQEKSEPGNYVVAYKPTIINVAFNKEADQFQLSLHPYLVEYNDSKEVIIWESQIEATAEPSSELEKYYLQQTSGIDLTTKLKT